MHTTFGAHRSGPPWGDDRAAGLWEAFEDAREAFGQRMGPRGGQRRMGRGDVRTAILAILAEQPMHGYQLIGEIEERSGGTWRPSPGSVYPTLQLLADEGLVRVVEAGEKKTYELTEAGREASSSTGPLPWEAASSRRGDRPGGALPKAGVKLARAVSQLAPDASPEQTERAVAVLDEARRKIYAILADG